MLLSLNLNCIIHYFYFLLLSYFKIMINIINKIMIIHIYHISHKILKFLSSSNNLLAPQFLLTIDHEPILQLHTSIVL